MCSTIHLNIIFSFGNVLIWFISFHIRRFPNLLQNPFSFIEVIEKVLIFQAVELINEVLNLFCRFHRKLLNFDIMNV